MKIRFVGYYQRFDESEITNGDTLYGNYLYYPLKKLIDILNTDYKIQTVYSDDFDIIVFCDLDQELFEYAKKLPKKIKKILVLTESVIYTPFAHHLNILVDPVWAYVVSYNREYHTPNTIYYDIPVTGIQLPVNMATCNTDIGCHIASYKNDTRGYTFERDKLITELANKNNIHVYGSGWQFKKNYLGKTADKIQTISQYKYYIALENAKYSGYVTEKLGDAILAEKPSLYFGDIENARRRFGNTFIPLNGLTYKDFNIALEKLNADYDYYKNNVLEEKKKSIYWCDSYHNAMIQAITQ